MRQELEVIYKKSSSEDKEPAFMEAVKPIREHVGLEEIIKEQGYKPCSYEEFREVADQIDWGDITLDEMLEAIK